MPEGYNINRRQTIRGGYTPFVLEDKGIADKLFDAVQNLNERQIEVKKQKGIVMEALNKVPVHESEQGYVNKLGDKLSAKLMEDPFNVAAAYEAASEATNDKGLMGRAKYFQQWEQERKIVNSRNDINQDTKDYWLAVHPYDYKDKIENGKVVGGIDFRPDDQPVEDIDWEKAVTTAFNMTSPEKSDSETQSASYMNGSGSSSLSASGFTRVTEDRIRENLTQYISTHMPAVEQGYRVAKFKHEQKKKQLESLDPSSAEYNTLKQEIANEEKYLFKNGGNNLDDYINHNVNNSSYLKNFAYNWTTSKKHSSSNVNESNGGSGGGNGSGAGAGGGYDNPYGNNYVTDNKSKPVKGWTVTAKGGGLGFNVSTNNIPQNESLVLNGQ